MRSSASLVGSPCLQQCGRPYAHGPVLVGERGVEQRAGHGDAVLRERLDGRGPGHVGGVAQRELIRGGQRLRPGGQSQFADTAGRSCPHDGIVGLEVIEQDVAGIGRAELHERRQDGGDHTLVAVVEHPGEPRQRALPRQRRRAATRARRARASQGRDRVRTGS